MKKGFYTLIGATILASGLALATPASAQWNNLDHSGSSYASGDHTSSSAPMGEDHHAMHHGKKHHEHMHKHHHHHKHHKDDAKKDGGDKK
jgi:hypothetical protein